MNKVKKTIDELMDSAETLEEFIEAATQLRDAFFFAKTKFLKFLMRFEESKTWVGKMGVSTFEMVLKKLRLCSVPEYADFKAAQPRISDPKFRTALNNVLGRKFEGNLPDCIGVFATNAAGKIGDPENRANLVGSAVQHAEDRGFPMSEQAVRTLRHKTDPQKTVPQNLLRIDKAKSHVDELEALVVTLRARVRVLEAENRQLRKQLGIRQPGANT